LTSVTDRQTYGRQTDSLIALATPDYVKQPKTMANFTVKRS